LHKAALSLAVSASAATRSGGCPAGYIFGEGEDDLEGREALEGTLFVRTASPVLDRLGWAHEFGKELIGWDHCMKAITTGGR